MPRFSRDELVEIRTLMNLGQDVDKFWDRRGRRNWKFESLKSAVRRLWLNGGSVERKHGSGRPKTAVFDIMSARVQASVVSPPRNPGTHRTQREIAKDLGIWSRGRRMVRRIHLTRPLRYQPRRTSCLMLF
ncbi:hypothetical protein L596_025730 [Steinernema carpocapsae]|uniref:Uncharacterized protein n=1 Tax=Steinernema carpocapsae TaxID=34508 RepID=A0A4U5M8M7_STECR|nr:hypothetical protein L596_025730 [Steinernema carpocapsae]